MKSGAESRPPSLPGRLTELRGVFDHAEHPAEPASNARRTAKKLAFPIVPFVENVPFPEPAFLPWVPAARLLTSDLSTKKAVQAEQTVPKTSNAWIIQYVFQSTGHTPPC
jgi:hypothetical protein